MLAPGIIAALPLTGCSWDEQKAKLDPLPSALASDFGLSLLPNRRRTARELVSSTPRSGVRRCHPRIRAPRPRRLAIPTGVPADRIERRAVTNMSLRGRRSRRNRSTSRRRRHSTTYPTSQSLEAGSVWPRHDTSRCRRCAAAGSDVGEDRLFADRRPSRACPAGHGFRQRRWRASPCASVRLAVISPAGSEVLSALRGHVVSL